MTAGGKKLEKWIFEVESDYKFDLPNISLTDLNSLIC